MGRGPPQAPIKSHLGRPSGAPGKPTGQCNDTRSIVAGVRPSRCPQHSHSCNNCLSRAGRASAGTTPRFSPMRSRPIRAASGPWRQLTDRRRVARMVAYRRRPGRRAQWGAGTFWWNRLDRYRLWRKAERENSRPREILPDQFARAQCACIHASRRANNISRSKWPR